MRRVQDIFSSIPPLPEEKKNVPLQFFEIAHELKREESCSRFVFPFQFQSIEVVFFFFFFLKNISRQTHKKKKLFDDPIYHDPLQ